MDLRTKHNRVKESDASTNKFGKCPNPAHTNRFCEYYDKRSKKALCTQCAIERTMGKPEDLQKKDENGNLDIESSLEPLDQAYDVAKKKAAAPDNDLSVKKEEIRQKLETVK